MKAADLTPGTVAVVAVRGSGRILYGSPSRTMRVRVTGRAGRTMRGRRSAMLQGVNLATGRVVKFHPSRVLNVVETDSHVARETFAPRPDAGADGWTVSAHPGVVVQGGEPPCWCLDHPCRHDVPKGGEPSDADPATGIEYGGLS